MRDILCNNAVCISQRPDIVEKRARIGDWEADTVIGKQGAAVLVTLVERKSRFSLVIKARNKTAKAATPAIIVAMQPISRQVHTLTYDNGKEFAYHQKIAQDLDAKGFFAHPYRSWERGLNENTNGLIRQYSPKGIEIGRHQRCTGSSHHGPTEQPTQKMPWLQYAKSGIQ